VTRLLFPDYALLAVPAPARHGPRPVLRDYQHAAIAAIGEALGQHRSTLAVLATGLGKTVIFGAVAAEWPRGRVLILAHRKELIWQAADKLTAATGVAPDVELADLRATGTHPVTIASVQSLLAPMDCSRCSDGTCGHCKEGRSPRFARLDPLAYGLIVIDECHHAPSASYRAVLSHFEVNPDLRILGVTATPDRADEAALGNVFASVAYEYHLPDGIRDGWLVEPRQHFVQIESLDLSAVRTTAGDLNEGDVDRAIREDRTLYGIVEATIEIAAGRPTLLFLPSVEAAQKAADMLAARDLPAAFVHGGTPPDDRRRLLAEFAEGKRDWLVNCGVFLEGFDSPRIEVVAMARPTKSRALYAQAVGRGTRPLHPPRGTTPDERLAEIAASRKPHLDVIDFVGNAGRHKLVCTADILGGNYDDDVIEAATKAVREKGEGSMREALDAAEAATRRREEEAKRVALRRQVQARVTYTTETIDPFDMFDLRAPREPGWHKGRTATDRQREALVKFGVPETTARGLSFVKASALMDELLQRRRDGLCTYRQATFLRSHGIDGAAVTFERASELFDAIKANGWKKPEGLEP